MFLLEGSGASALDILDGAESCYRSTPTVKHVIRFEKKPANLIGRFAVSALKQQGHALPAALRRIHARIIEKKVVASG